MLSARDEARGLEHLHMLRRAGEAHLIRFGKLADRGLAERELGEHAPPRRIGQRVEYVIESILNHVVEYRRVNDDCQLIG